MPSPPLPNLDRNEMFISLVSSWLADIPDRCLIEIAIARNARLCDQDLRTECICGGNEKSDFIAKRHPRSKKTGQRQPGLIAKHAERSVGTQVDLCDTPTTDWGARNGGPGIIGSFCKSPKRTRLSSCTGARLRKRAVMGRGQGGKLIAPARARSQVIKRMRELPAEGWAFDCIAAPVKRG